MAKLIAFLCLLGLLLLLDNDVKGEEPQPGPEEPVSTVTAVTLDGFNSTGGGLLAEDDELGEEGHLAFSENKALVRIKRGKKKPGKKGKSKKKKTKKGKNKGKNSDEEGSSEGGLFGSKWMMIGAAVSGVLLILTIITIYCMCCKKSGGGSKSGKGGKSMKSKKGSKKGSKRSK